MIQVLFYSGLLVAGMAGAQLFDLGGVRGLLNTLTMICLSYIMIQVGLEFHIDKKNLRSYGTDYLVAATAAAFPWIFCAVYFVFMFDTSWKEALLVGRFAAPTSAGVLFTMLAAAGLASTWLFKKARVLAIFDDLDTVLFMIPLKMMIVGMKPELFWVVAIIFLTLFLAYRFLHQIHLPTGKSWILLYAVAVTLACEAFYHATHVHLEVLLPAFMVGCVLYEAHHDESAAPAKSGFRVFEQGMDQFLKGIFMLFVGLSLPKIELGGISMTSLVMHVLALTLLSNIGKSYASFCYRKEASLRERIALSVGMFPRGEVGAGVLLVSIGYGMKGLPVTVAAVSLALNLLLTGLFILVIMRLIRRKV